MASLPSNTFICNYNARDYIAATYTISKTSGQTFNQDMVLTRQSTSNMYPTDHSDVGYITFTTSGISYPYNFANKSENIFNRYDNNTGRSLTIVYKASSSFGAADNNLLANRDGSCYNYMVRQGMFHTNQSGFLPFTASSSPSIMYIRIDNTGYSERKCVTTEQIATSSTIDYGCDSSGIAFFRTSVNGTSEYFIGDFYWIYVSTETLTDAEILKVIQYNEEIDVFGPDDDSFSATYTGLTTSTTLNAEDLTWSATTIPSWISVSPTTGSGTTTIELTANKNNTYSTRTGTVIFTSSEGDTAEISIVQEKHPLLVPKNNIYRGGLLVN